MMANQAADLGPWPFWVLSDWEMRWQRLAAADASDEASPGNGLAVWAVNWAVVVFAFAPWPAENSK